MTTVYKLTDQSYRTYNGTQWGEGFEHTASGEGGLCGPGWLHAYTHPLLAVLLNPVHADIKNPIVWEAEGDMGIEDHGLKVGCRRLKTIKIIPLPRVTLEQRVRFGILCSLEVCTEPSFVSWAHEWLSGENRWEEAAGEVAWAAKKAAEGEWWASWAARVAADAAWWAALVAAKSGKNIDLIALAEKACEFRLKF